MSVIKNVLKLATKPVREGGKAFLRNMLYLEYTGQVYDPNERSVEYRFVFEVITRTAPKTVLDVGTGKTALPHLMQTCGLQVTAIDNIYDYWSKYGMFNRHFYVIDDDITRTVLKGGFDLITCISTLEHIANADAAVRNMASLLTPGGHLVITCPYTEQAYQNNVYTLAGTTANAVDYICQSFSRDNLNTWTASNGLKIVAQEYDPLQIFYPMFSLLNLYCRTWLIYPTAPDDS